MLVTAIEPLLYSKSKDRYKVYILDGRDLVLYKKEISRFGINVGEEISESVYAALLEEIFIPRAKRRAMYLLERQNRTRENLRNKLRESGYPIEAVEQALKALDKYVDDRNYVKSYILSKQNTRSKRRICNELYNKGVSKEVLEIAIREMEEEYGENIFNERKIIRNYINKNRRATEDKISQKKLDKRIYDYLLRNGFASGDILRELGQDNYIS